MTDQSNRNDTIEGKRRRQGASSGPSSSERAEMPSRQRERESGGQSRPPSSGAGGSGAGGAKLPIWVVILLLIGYAIYSLLFAGDQPDTSTENNSTAAVDVQATQAPIDVIPAAVEPTSPAEPVVTAPTKAPVAEVTGGQKWTVMLYEDADDQILEEDMYMDLNEVERVGSSNQVQIVAQVDRFKGAFKGDGNWTSTRRYHMTKDNDLSRLQSELVQDMGELDMADGKTLADFVTWAARTYPADHYVLILSDHGMGWPGGFSDPAPATADPSKTALAAALEDDQLYLMEIEKTLGSVIQKAGIGEFELIGMDACLMGQLEVLSALEPYAHYAVLSQETEPALGWAYTSFLQALVDNPDMSGADLGKAIVRSYIKEDQRITDNQARADFTGQRSSSAAEVAKEMVKDVTLSAVDLSRVPDLNSSVNNLAYLLQSEDQEVIANARNFAPAYTNVFGKDKTSPYIDLGGFAQMLGRHGAEKKTSQAADDVLAKIKVAVVAEKHGESKPGSTGISIYFPVSSLYRSPIAGAKTYTTIANAFSKASLWDDFLAFHYNDISFKPAQRVAVYPSSDAPGRAPGLGQIQVSKISASSKVASPGKPVTLTAKVSGKNIGYIYFFAGFSDNNTRSIYEADTDYIESPDTRELNGVYYPVWSDKPFNLKLDWDPTVFQITDGDKTVVTLFTPETYGLSAKDAIYTVDGIYHYADGTSRSARLYFRDGVMRHVFGYTDQNETGGVHEIIPKAGDTFTLLDNWFDLDANGKVTGSAVQEGETLTFGSQPFQWKEVYAAPGDYIVGFVVADLDGNTQQMYTTISVK